LLRMAGGAGVGSTGVQAGRAQAARAGRGQVEDQQDVLFEVTWLADQPAGPTPARVSPEGDSSARAAAMLHLLTGSSGAPAAGLSSRLVAVVASALAALGSGLAMKANMGLATMAAYQEQPFQAADLLALLSVAGLQALMRTLMQVRGWGACGAATVSQQKGP